MTGSKNRPAIVLLHDELDVVCAFITTQTGWQEEHDLLLNPSATNGLKKTSLVRLGKLATLDTNLVLGKMGELAFTELKALNEKLINLFKLTTP